MEVILNDIKTMCVRADGGPVTAKAAFYKLESKLESLRGRKFYGAICDGVYRACVELMGGDDPEKLGFETCIIPRGKYVQEKILDRVHHIANIGPTFDKMTNQHEEDTQRPRLEFYKSQKELLLFLPIK